jgi:hypothetical protein
MISTADPEHVSALTAMMYPGLTRKCDHCDGYVTISTEDVMSALTATVGEPYASLLRSAAQPSAKAMLGVQMPASRSWTGAPGWTRPEYASHGPHKHHKHHGHDKHHGYHRHDDDCGCGYDDYCGCGEKCECRSCRRDDCHCRCCIVDADLVVHTRLGERRVVPILVENDRRREKEVELDLSEFRTKGGSRTSIFAAVTPTQFVLGPCEEREVLILIEVRPEDGQDDGGDKKDAAGKAKAAAGRQAKVEHAESVRAVLGGRDDDRLIDVDECVVAYGDLRFGGCENRPLRIAVSTLPRDCHAYHVRCSCGCC